MKYFGKAEQTADAIVKAFEEGRVPAALSQVFIADAKERHSSAWSFMNQFIMAMHGYTDAMGFKQWQKKHERTVKKGEKAFYILAPVMRNITDETTLDEKGKPTKRQICIGFKGVTVFGYEQTEGPEIKQGDKAEQFLETLPLRNLAEKWGLSVRAYNGQEGQALGVYSLGSSISLGTENLSTWTHELAHAADDRLGTLSKSRKPEDRALDEVVAEFAGAVLLKCLGEEEAADLGGAWDYIQGWAKRTDSKPVDACRKVLNRVIKIVEYTLEEAGITEKEEAA
jgi:antirestriction protein ArdC